MKNYWIGIFAVSVLLTSDFALARQRREPPADRTLALSFQQNPILYHYGCRMKPSAVGLISMLHLS